MSELQGPAVWRSAEINRSTRWRFELEPAVATQMAEAARAALASCPSAVEVDRTHFGMPPADGLCDRIHDEIENGVGFAVIGGLPFDDLNYDEQRALTLGLSDHIGRVVPQNYELQRIVDIRDEGIEYSHRSRGYRSNKHLPFHTDGAHLFSLTCLGVAEKGGETIISSASAVYN